MLTALPLVSFDDWIIVLREQLCQTDPELMDVFETYVDEAKFARSFIDADLSKLHKGASILEVGAGAMILSCQLMREGYAVTALEPVGEGFSHFTQLRLFVLDQAKRSGHAPKLLPLPAEDLQETNVYDFAFSIFVMEHVGNVEMTIRKVTQSLKHKACYRFICPNYAFPYEPHFNIPTFFNKKITEKMLKNKIFNDIRFPDPRGVWASLNWISVSQVKRAASVTDGLAISFNENILSNTFKRAISDDKFSARRSAFVVKLAKIMALMSVDGLLKYIPASLSPIIDCTITKR